jgi:hypothetical protein
LAVTGTVNDLRLSDLASFFHEECRSNLQTLLQYIVVQQLDMEFVYHEGGRHSFVFTGYILLGKVALSLTYVSPVDGDWSFDAILGPSAQAAGTTVGEFLQSICGNLNFIPLPDFINNCAIPSITGLTFHVDRVANSTTDVRLFAGIEIEGTSILFGQHCGTPPGPSSLSDELPSVIKLLAIVLPSPGLPNGIGPVTSAPALFDSVCLIWASADLDATQSTILTHQNALSLVIPGSVVQGCSLRVIRSGQLLSTAPSPWAGQKVHQVGHCPDSIPLPSP